jgi:hypothetical protein
MIFIETSVFTKVITTLIPEDCYKELQQELLLRPDAGALIRGGGGIRKIRWNAGSTGKRGGIRIIYYLDLPDRVFMLYAYKKNKQEDLSPEQLRVLKQVVSEWLL